MWLSSRRAPTLLVSLMLVPVLAACPGDDGDASVREVARPAADAQREADPALAAVAGKLGCTASQYDAGSQSYEFQPRGSVVLEADGSYRHLGFREPSSGEFRVDARGVVGFTGGYLEGGELSPMEDRPGRFYLVFPANPDNRWTCGRLEDGE